MLRAKVGQGVIIHRHAAANPAKGDMVPAQAIQLPRTSHAAKGCVEPQREENSRIGGRLTGAAFDRLDSGDQFRQIEPAYVGPSDFGLVVVWQQFIERTLLKSGLIPNRLTQPSGAASRRQLRLRRPIALLIKEHAL